MRYKGNYIPGVLSLQLQHLCVFLPSVFVLLLYFLKGQFVHPSHNIVLTSITTYKKRDFNVNNVIFHLWNNATVLPRNRQVHVKGLYRKMSPMHVPSVKLLFSQPLEEGVVHGETPSSPSTMMQVFLLTLSPF